MDHARRTELTLYTVGGRRKYLRPAERARFTAGAEHHPHDTFAVFCLVLAHTGCRISEALALRPDDIDLNDGTISFLSLKKRGRIVVRQVPIPDTLVMRLDALCGTRDPQARLWPWTRGWAWFLVKGIMAASGIPPGPHRTAKGLRHGFGVHAVRSRVPLNLIQRWLGHASLATTAIYLDVADIEERELAARMWT